MGKPGLWGPAKTHDRQRTSAANWNKPIQWNKRAQAVSIVDRVFSLSLADFFEPHPQLVPIRAAAWDVIRATPFLSYMLLTKRPECIADMLPPDWGSGWINVGIGTSVENMKVAHRIPTLAAVPALYRFISYEPALGPLHEADLTGVDQILYGGESGPGFRPHDLAWPRAMRERCARDGIAFFYKQGAAPRTEMYQELDGERIEQYPDMWQLAHDRIDFFEEDKRLRSHGFSLEAVRGAMFKRSQFDRDGMGTTGAKELAENSPVPLKRSRSRELPSLEL